MKLHSEADENYYIEAGKLLELANKAYELFQSSEDEEKRELLEYLLRNSKMDGEKILPELKMPFDAIITANKTQNWLTKWNDFRIANWGDIVEYPEFMLQQTSELLYAQ